MQGRKARLKKAAKILLFLLIIDGCLLGLAEAVARLGWPPFYKDVAKKEKLSLPKPAGTKRIFVYGESTIYGFPYGPENSTARWVQLLLEDQLPGQPIQVVNFGRPARGSFHLDEAVAATLSYQPDVVVLCLGHNEFLPRSLALAHQPTHRWWYFHVYLYRASVDGLNNYRSRKQTDEPANFKGIPPWSPEYAQSVQAYLANVLKMVERCQKANVPVVLCAPACNLVSPPRLSVHRQELSAADQARHAKLMLEIRTKVRKSEDASSEIAQALLLSPDYAETYYWQGRQFLAEHKPGEAVVALEKARDLDCLCFRCTGPMLDGVRRIAQAKGIPLADFPAAFLRKSEQSPPGMNWFMDACHPRPWGQYILAEEIVGTMRLQKLLGSTTWRTGQPLDFKDLAPRIGLTATQWRTPERTGALHLLQGSPELVSDMTDIPPAQGTKEDVEWRALQWLAQQRCGKKVAPPSALDPTSLAPIMAAWPPQVQQWWKDATK